MRLSLYGTVAVALASIVLIQSVHSQPYKIVDKDGNITFSQYPPVEADEEVTVENVEVSNSSSGKTALSTRPNGQQYCGDLSLPTAPTTRNGSDRFLSQVTSRQSQWERRLADLEQNIEKINNSQFSNNKGSIGQAGSYRAQRSADAERRKQAVVQDARDLRCAIVWARSQSEDSGTYFDDQAEEYERLQEVYDRLLSQQTSECGDEPYLDPSSIGQTSRRNNWERCSGRYSSKIRSVEREIQSVSRSLGNFN